MAEKPYRGVRRSVATNVGTTGHKVFSSGTVKGEAGPRSGLYLSNNHASQKVYVFLANANADAPTMAAAGSNYTLAAGGAVELEVNEFVDVYVLGSGASTDYAAVEMV